MNVPVNGLLMKQKATALACEMEIADWEASDGWLHSFKIRHGLTFKTVCAKMASRNTTSTYGALQSIRCLQCGRDRALLSMFNQ